MQSPTVTVQARISVERRAQLEEIRKLLSDERNPRSLNSTLDWLIANYHAQTAQKG